MTTGWRYRIAAVLGVAAMTSFAVYSANNPAIQALVQFLPLLDGLPADTATGAELLFEVSTALVVVLAAFLPMYRPRPRRILDTITLAQRRTFLALTALAAIGYFDYTWRLPRLTVLVATPLLFVLLPAWFVAIRRRPNAENGRAIVIGDDPYEMAEVLRATDLPVVGYVSPPSANRLFAAEPEQELADGGTPAIDDLVCLGGLSRLEEVLVEHDVDTAILAFSQPDRAEFFGALDACYDHGVQAKVHRDHADSVLTTDVGEGPIVDVDLEPWDWQDHVTKRLFDVGFSLSALLLLSPVVLAIAIAIKLDDGGRVLYSQERTTVLGDTFEIYKFRSMVENAEATTGATLSEEDVGGVDPRVTRVGGFIRRTHLDEIPQVWSILVGKMSAVGPRPERPELEMDMDAGGRRWSSRWFVKPGLTGLAQVEGATGHDPEAKLRYDVEYIRQRSFWVDLKIVIRQTWMVAADAVALRRDER